MGDVMTIREFLREIELSDYTKEELKIVKELFEELSQEINEMLE
jgi:hypothetical protein